MILSVIKKNWISALRGEYIDFIISRITFVCFSTATAAVLRKVFDGETSGAFKQSTLNMDYLGFILAGSLLYALTMSIYLNVSRSLMTELREGTLEVLLLAPFPRWKYYLGAGINQTLTAGLDTLVCAVIAVLIGLKPLLDPQALVCGLLLLWGTLFGISCLSSLLMIRLRDTFFVQNTLLPLLLIAGGYLFPVDLLPTALRPVTTILPLARAVELVRSGLLSGGSDLTRVDAIYAVEALLLALVGLLLLPLVERHTLEHYPS